MAKEGLAHPDAGICNKEAVLPGSLRSGGLHSLHQDVPPGRGEFDGVPHHVKQHLAEAEAVTDHLRVVQGPLDGEGEALGLGLLPDHNIQVLEQLLQRAGGVFQVDLTAFNAAHIQHPADKGEQMPPRHLDLVQVVPHQLPVLQMGGGQGGKAQDGV